ncbi:DnaJ domain-containing protein, partial [Staphylotrichum tortipilum]
MSSKAGGRPPNYYSILDIPPSATPTQIHAASKNAALKTHPDRLPTSHPDRPRRTHQFQLVNDAYYTLSDPARRREYDAQRRLFGTSDEGSTSSSASSGTGTDNGNRMPGHFQDEAEPETGGGGGGATPFSWFASVFEEMLREEGLAEDGNGRPTSAFWSVLGGISGGALGFIVANVPGLVAGAVAGNRLGAVRDAKGKSVYAVFQ